MSAPDIAARLGLNAQQAQALTITQDGIIAAGAGAGKTQTLTALVCRDIIVDELPPERVAVVTFTRAAAANLTSRVAEHLAALGDDASPDITGLYVHTIDGLCGRLLREHALDAGLLPGFTVGDERMIRPLREAAWEQTLNEAAEADLLTLADVVDPHASELHSEIDRAHDALRLRDITPERAREPQAALIAMEERQDLEAAIERLLAESDAQTTTLQKNLSQDLAAVRAADWSAFSTLKYGKLKSTIADTSEKLRERITAHRQALIDLSALPCRQAAVRLLRAYATNYATQKKEASTLDFTDLAVCTQNLLGGDGFGGFQRLYVDEAQDTNPMQLQLLRCALAPEGRMLIVGDSLQSIYSFRLADVRGFRQQAAAAKMRVDLTRNYRSQPSVLNPINALCSRVPELNADLIVMEAIPEQQDPREHPSVELVRVLGDTADSETEARALAEHTLRTRDRLGMRNADICVLCTANKDAASYADAFRSLNVPALLMQRKGLLGREECLDVLAYLQMLAQPEDEAALLRVLSSPFAGFSDLELYRLCAARPDAPREDPSLRRRPVALLPRLRALAPAWVDLYEAHRALVGVIGVADLARRAVEDHSFLLALEIADSTGALRRNIEKMIMRLAELESEQHGPALEVVLAHLQKEVAAGLDEGQDATLPPDLDAVRVMTVHNAKGDEFPLTVIGRLSKQRQSEQSKVWVNETGDLGFVLGSKGTEDSVAACAKRQRTAVVDEEQRRLLYVALTRAQRHIIIGASAKLKKDGTASWQGAAQWLLHPQTGCAPELDPAESEGTDVQVLVAGADVRGQTPMSALVRVLRLDPGTTASPLPRRAPTSKHKPTEDVPEEQPTMLASLSETALSYTKLSQWGSCSLRRHLEGDLGLRETPWDVDNEAGSTDDAPVNTGARAFGIRFHELLRDSNWKELPLEPTQRMGGDSERANKLLRAVSEHSLATRLSAAECYAERRFDFALGGHLLGGSMDVLALESEGVLIVEWKTGEDPENAFAEDYQFQRRLYALVALRDPDRPARVEIVTAHLHSLPIKCDSEVFTRKDQAGLEKEVTAHITKVMTGEAAPAALTEQPFCRGCPGRERICPVSASRRMIADNA